ncbi:hypothetical protein JXQ70_03670 [bacterium]|nr:hypothetical protein [bacterium]
MGPFAINFEHIEAERSIRTVCAYLGSFDPPHRAHQWIANYLADRFDLVLLLVPVIHFEKQISFPGNALPEQRLEMLRFLCQEKQDRLRYGLSPRILFIELEQFLQCIWPWAAVYLGMGSETYGKLLESRDYYQRIGKVWTEFEQNRLADLVRRTLVFNRKRSISGGICLPHEFKKLSSTGIRNRVAQMHARHVSPNEWPVLFADSLIEPVVDYIYSQGLYRDCSRSS